MRSAFASRTLARRTPRFTAGRHLLLLGTFLILALPTLAAEPAPGAGPQSGKQELRTQQREDSTRELGQEVCAPYPTYCGDVWKIGMEHGEPFNRLIADTCLWVGHLEDEDAGIACAETAIRAVPTLPDAVLIYGQFAPGERRRHVYWSHQTDREWARVSIQYIQRIPEFCDQSTPVIYDYYPCLLREVQFFQTVLKKVERFWNGPQRS